MRPLSAEQRRLLDRLLDRQGIGRGDARITRVADERSGLPLSFAQQRIWYLNRMLPEETMYNVAGAARLRGNLDVDVMRRCLTETVRRHEVLRTTYHVGPDGKGGVQRVNEAPDLQLPVTDLRHLAGDALQAAVREHCASETSRPFDLETDLMLRPLLLRLADDEYLMILCQHHVATDGWSLNLLIREIAALYGAFSAGQESPLEPLDLQYGDFAAWQRRYLTPEKMEEELVYWRERLHETRLVDAATGLPRPTTLTWDGGTVRYRMPAELVSGLTRLAESERATPYMALVAAYSVVLARWSGQDDIIIGCPIAGRTRGEIAPLIGCFLNELPLRMDLSGEPTYRELLRQARDVCLGAYDHQDVPFEKMVEEVNPERDSMSHAPLVRHQLGLHNEPRYRIDLPEVSFEVEALSTNTARFDLEVDLTVEDDGEISGMVYYSTDLYREDVVRRMLDRLTTVVAGAVADPDLAVWRLPLLGAAERETVTTELAGVPEATEPSTVHALVERRAATAPDAIAVLDHGTPWTYQELDVRANQLAHWLRHLGVGTDTPVPVVLTPSALRLVAMLAVLKAGGAAVPLNPEHKGADVRAAITDTRSKLVLTDGDTLLDSRLRLDEVDGSVRMLALDTVGERIEGYPGTPPGTAVSTDALAVLSYAKKISGTPAGLCTTHAGVVHRLTWMSGRFPLTVGEHVLPRARAGLDAAPWDLLWPLTAGATLVVDEGVPATVGTLRTTPSALEALLADPAVHGLRGTLRRIVLDAEQPWPALLADVERALPGVEVETLTGAAEAAADIVTRSSGGARLFVLDHHTELVPIGVPGELWLGLPYEPRGFWGRPVCTAAAFVPDPSRPGARLYRSGLRARWLADGTLDLLGPAEHAFTLQGHRVEFSELAGSLAAHAEVGRAAVLPHPDPEAGLVSYVSLREDSEDSGDVERWRKAFEEAYGNRAAEADPGLNLGGWTSPSTGDFVSAGEMGEWAEATFRRVLGLRPHDVLEIGCRTGSLLFKLAARCDGAYVGTDLSARALTRIRQHQDWLATKAESVRLLERGPDDFSGLDDDSFDTVVFNGVVSYFPGLGHLEHVLRESLRVVRDGGRIYLGDVRSLPLAQALHLSAPWGAADPDDPADALLEQVSRRAGAEEELVVAPEAFVDLASRLPGVTGVSLLPKLGRGRNELSLFRYDVVLHIGGQPADVPWTTLDWDVEGLTTARLKDRLAGQSQTPLMLAGVPDIRLNVKLQSLELLHSGRVRTVGELTESIRPVLAAPGGPVDPQELVTAGQDAGYEVSVRCSGTGTVDVLLLPRAGDGPPLGPVLSAVAPAAQPPGEWTNDPVRAARIRSVSPQLRSHLQVYFPTYMIPSAFVMVDDWPLHLDGTLDHTRLPLPVTLPADEAAAQREPATETEKAIAKIWADALGLDRIGVHDDFFALGGHSLLGVEVVEKVREVYDVDLPLGRLFESPTVAAAAEYIDGVQATGDGAPKLVPIQRIDRSSYRTRRNREAATAAAR
ncbi:condensation domain-containing protein [Streptomyces sp. NPDC046862]|uniref:non-ribosomal peptide synthetase n=1 Tax=Streptomyces sp. NPDC046862 TaxID=3154603 RepID=UPI003455DA7D